MNKKLTLNMDEELIDFAHKLARESHQSVSRIVSEYLESLRLYEESTELTQRTRNLYGAFAHTPIPDKQDLRTCFHEKGIG